MDPKMDEQQLRRQGPDPRLRPMQGSALNALAVYGRIAGWAGGILTIATLFCIMIYKTIDKLPIKIIGIMALVCLAFWIYSNLHQLIIGVRTRGFQTALNSALFTVFVLGILVLVNYTANRHQVLRHDFTQNKMNSLSDATVKLLKSLDKNIKFTAFLGDGVMADDQRRMLNEYRLASPRITVDTYDFRTAIDKAQEYGARFAGTIYVECGEGSTKKQEEVQGSSEEQLTSAILAVTTGEKTRICFLTGHGEASLDATEDNNPNAPTLSMLKTVLTSQQYKVDTLSLYTQKAPQVPSDCKLLIIAGAKTSPTPAEMTAITKYVDQGGNLFLMLEPTPAPNFAALLKAHGVTPMNGTVSDAQQPFGGSPQILAAVYDRQNPHDITRVVQLVVMPTATGLEVEANQPPPAMPGAPPPSTAQNATPLLLSSDAATISGQPGRRGPFDLAVAIDETPKPPVPMFGQPTPPPDNSPRKARIIVVGDADFASDSLVQALGLSSFGKTNLGFALASVNWLLKNDKLVSIPPKQESDKSLMLTDSQKRFTWAVTIGIVPLLIILAGGLMWWLRRRA